MAASDHSAAAPRAHPAPRRALALCGGGFRASSVETGLTSGLLAAAHAMRPGAEASPTLRSTGIYARFDAMASVSGGSWFAAELIYSEQFVALVEEMAVSPAEAAAMHRARWTEPLLSVLKTDSAFAQDIARVLQLLRGAGSAQDFLALDYLWQEGFTWTTFCNTLFEKTAGIDSSVTLGSPVSPWAGGKAWLVAHTRVTPSAQTGMRAHILEQAMGRWWQWWRPARAITLRVGASPGLSTFTPATYSYVLGSAKTPAPVPYVSTSALPQDARLEYRASVKSRCPCANAKYKARARVGDFSDLVAGAADLPVISCAAASSAAFGNVVLGELPTLRMDAIGGDLAMWQGAGPAGESFSRASALVSEMRHGDDVNQAAVDRLADELVQPVIDAGFVDNSGIGCAVSAGAVEVVAFLANDASNAPKFVVSLFQGAPQSIFEQTTEWMESECARFPTLRICAGAKFLTAISVGTLDVTTAQSSLWGTCRGSRVTLHLVSVASTVTAGYLENMYDYDVLAQEVIETIVAPENAGLVQNTVMPWLLGPAQKAEQAGGESTQSPQDTRSEPGSTASASSADGGRPGRRA